MDNDDQQQRKRQRPTKPDLNDVLDAARVIWRRENKQGATQLEDAKFRHHFGCGAAVCLALWSMLVTTDLLPPDAALHHLLWTLMFMKIYNATAVCNMAGGIDRKTLDKWVWATHHSMVLSKQYQCWNQWWCVFCSSALFSNRSLSY